MGICDERVLTKVPEHLRVRLELFDIISTGRIEKAQVVDLQGERFWLGKWVM